MIENLPSSTDLEETALRIHFDAWRRTIGLIFEFSEAYQIEGEEEPETSEDYKGEWIEYIRGSQAEMGAIFSSIQHSAELRLKSIICEVSPFLLLLNNPVPLKSGKSPIDFTNLRTIDAVDLPNAVRTLSEFPLLDSFDNHFNELRKRRNQHTHLGIQQNNLVPNDLIQCMNTQYNHLWPDGNWLYRRTTFDGNSARRFFNDHRYASVQSDVMIELETSIPRINNEDFNKMFRCKKSDLKVYCPFCMGLRATKWHSGGHPTAVRTGGQSAQCMMCKQNLLLAQSFSDETSCPNCLTSLLVYLESTENSYVCNNCSEVLY
ncbi:hypothetical protein [Thalassospira lucentensis]|uniref:Uncharacterized protein n=1 Tax=Thalassospira lucentensis TaxID=168935 RepID=A0A358HZB1_9PROT|nr:hypothetical protein [Thalassospira lucentensis]HBV00518.1 hypothetical protein [Thalassospira lucentensis]HCW66407.1 hypothetical protein [Thalassospira lucentensis]|tara:strand:- start:1275 stop:2231 length:957 start_codon:yes stop_codon:yes gene_type:complete